MTERGVVGLLIMRSYVLAGNAAHYDGVIAALEARGLRVIPAFASGLDAAPGGRALLHEGRAAACVDAVVSLTGFSLVGGPAYNDAKAAEELLARLDVPYIGRASRSSSRTIRAVERVRARPAAGGGDDDGRHPRTRRRDQVPMVFGGRAAGTPGADGCERRCKFDMVATICSERAAMLAARVARLVALRRSERGPSARSLWCCSTSRPMPAAPAPPPTCRSSSRCSTLLNAMKRERLHGVELPESVRSRCASASSKATPLPLRRRMANVHARIPVDDHVRRERLPGEIEAAVGPGARASSRATAASLVLGERSSATSSSACSRPSATRATRCACCSRRDLRSDTRLLGLLPLAARGLRSTCGTALRYARRARVHAGQADRTDLGQVLAGPPDRRSAQPLSVCLEQPELRGRSPSDARRRRW